MMTGETSRAPPDRTRTACWFSTPTSARGPRYGSPTHSASSPAASTAGSTTPKPAGRGRALRANYGANYIWHTEGGKDTRGKFGKFQIRPDPLARYRGWRRRREPFTWRPTFQLESRSKNALIASRSFRVVSPRGRFSPCGTHLPSRFFGRVSRRSSTSVRPSPAGVKV